MRLCFHLGIHKTGSSLIQKNLLQNLNLLRDQRVFYVNAEMPGAIARQRNVLRRLQIPQRVSPPENALEGVNRKIIEAAQRADARVILLSEENRIGFPLYSQMIQVGTPAQFYPLADACLRRVLHGLDHLDTTLLLYQRRFDRLLPSLYCEALRNLAVTDTLDAFCEQIDFDSLSYETLCDRIASAAPHASLEIKHFETIRTGAHAFLLEFLSAFGIGETGFDFDTQVVRQAVDAQRAAELLALSRARVEFGVTREIRKKRREVLVRSVDRAAQLVLPEWVMDRLHGAEADHKRTAQSSTG